MKKFVYKTNACKNCCVTGNEMSKHIKYLEKLCLKYEKELDFYNSKIRVLGKKYCKSVRIAKEKIIKYKEGKSTYFPYSEIWKRDTASDKILKALRKLGE